MFLVVADSSIAEYLREQGSIGYQPISEQGHLMPIAHTRGSIGEQSTNQGFIPCSLNMGQNELAGRVYQFRFPGWLRLTTSKAIPFIGLQLGHGHILDFLFMVLPSMCAYLLVQTPYRAGVYLDQSTSALDTTALSQVFGHRNSFFLCNFAVPQGCVFAFTEFLLTTTTTQVTDIVPAIHFSDCQMVAAFLTVQVAVRVDTC